MTFYLTLLSIIGLSVLLFGSLDFSGYLHKHPKNPMKAIYKDYETDPLRELASINAAEEDPKFAKAQKKDITESFLGYLEYQAKNEANMLIGIEAPPGKGKSWVGLWCDTKWLEIQKRINNVDADLEFAFNSAQARNQLKKIKDKGVVHKDEDSTMQGNGKSTAEGEETNFAETMRFSGKSMVICAPHIALLSGMTILLQPQCILTTADPSKFETRVLVYFLQENNKGRTAKFDCLGYILAKIGEIDGKLLERYKKEKYANYRKLEKMGGGVGAMGKEDLKELRKLAKKVFKKAEKGGWPENPDQPSKRALDEYIADCELALTGKKENILKGLVVKEFHKSLSKPKKGKKNPTPNASTVTTDAKKPNPSTIAISVPFVPFVVDYEKVFAKMRTNCKPGEKSKADLERDIDIYLGSKDMLKTASMYAQKYNITEVWVGSIKKSMVGEVARLTGELYEEFLEPYFKTIYPKVEHLGGKGDPDYICETSDGQIILYSLKCYEIKRPSYDLFYDQANAEIIYARKIWDPKKKPADRPKKIPRVFSHLINLPELKVYEYEIEPIVIEKVIPFGNRKHTIEVGQFTRDPAVSGYITAIG